MPAQRRAARSRASLPPPVAAEEVESPETRWVSLFGCAPPRSASLIAQALAWQEQVLVSGDVTAAVRHDLTLAAEQVRAERMPDAAPDEGSAATMPTATSQLLPGTRLVKVHGGRTHVVEVTAAGMLYEGVVHASLSAVAKAITGTHWNGLLFFGLRKRRVYPARRAASHG